MSLDEELSELGFAARLFFRDLLCHVDREGRCEDRPRMLKALIMPWDEIDVDILLSELSPKFVIRYEVDGRRYLQVRNFLKHQRPHVKESDSKIPKCPNDILKKPGKGSARTGNSGTSPLDKGKGMDYGVGKGIDILGHVPARPVSDKPKKSTPVQDIVNAYKIAIGIKADDKGWDSANFGRYCKAAKSILEAFGGDKDRAAIYIIGKSEKFQDDEISFTLETIARHAWDDKGRINGSEHIKVDSDNILGRTGHSDASQLGVKPGEKALPEPIPEQAGDIILRESDHF